MTNFIPHSEIYKAKAEHWGLLYLVHWCVKQSIVFYGVLEAYPSQNKSTQAKNDKATFRMNCGPRGTVDPSIFFILYTDSKTKVKGGK